MMNENKLENFKNEIKNKKIAVLGIGISNIPAISYLVKLGAKVTARDKKEVLGQEADDLKELNIEYVLGEDYLEGLEEYDYILRSPGIKPFLPQIENAVKAGVILTSEIELVMSLAPCKIIGVTGSDGKTTSTTLIAKFLEEAGYRVFLGGNIGTPIFARLEEMKKEDIVVLELSSFQLMTLQESPNIAVITNVSPNHLDYHRNFEEYIMAKANIFLNQKADDLLVLNQDNIEFTKRYESLSKSNIRKFSIIDQVESGTYLEEGNIVTTVRGTKEIIEHIQNVKLVGMHMIANICTAITAVVDMTGIEPIRKVITTFPGVEHRMEFVREVNGVKWYNDSIASSPTRTIAGLKSFQQKLILISGGYDKNVPYDELGAYIIDKVKELILIGKTAPKIEDSVLQEAKKQGIELSLNIVRLTTMQEAVLYASKIAKSGDIVYLSPASASFDLYKNFEERGNHFKSLVNEL